METFKNVVVSNLIGCVVVTGACVGIVGASLALCGISALGLILAGG